MRQIPDQQHNLEQISLLSQRGPTLSIIDLIEAGTLTAEMAAYGLYLMGQGASVLTAAMPGSAGKTTLLACWLIGLPPEAHITTISVPLDLDDVVLASHRPQVMLVHEIGSGSWYGYLWGHDVARAFAQTGPGCMLASCIHADTLEQLTATLTGPDLSVPADHLNRIDLLCFLHLERTSTGYRRRVAAMYEAFGDTKKHRLIFQWHRDSDRFARMDVEPLHIRLQRSTGKSADEIADDLRRYERLLIDLQREGVRDFREVRRILSPFRGGSEYRAFEQKSEKGSGL